MSRCREFSSLLEPYSDGELSPDKIMEVEEHVESCERCAARVALDRSLKKSVRKVVYETAPTSPAFLARLGVALEAEREREAEAEKQQATATTRPLSWRSIASLAAAAALLLIWNAARRDGGPPSIVTNSTPKTAGVVDVDQFIEDLIDNHLNPAQSDPQQPEVTEAAQLEQFDRPVGVAVRLPQLRDFDARWESGRVLQLRNRRAAQLTYRVGGHKATLYVYDAKRVPIEQRLQQQIVRNRPVFVGSERGFSIAARANRGVGYALASDFNEPESAELMASLDSP